MLFDLRGKRKRFIQVVYALLAALFLISFVGFGVGSDAAGGIFDALGIGGGGTSSGNPQYEERIEDAEARLAANPGDPEALLELARTHALAGEEELDVDDNGFPVVTEEAQASFQASVDAWERYLETDPQQSAGPEEGDALGGAALQQINVQQLLIQTLAQQDPQALPPLLETAQETAQLAADERPSANAYLALARYAYFNGDTEAGDAAAQEVLSEVPEAQRQATMEQLEQLQRTGRQVQRFIEQTAPGEEQLTNPLLGEGAPVP